MASDEHGRSFIESPGCEMADALLISGKAELPGPAGRVLTRMEVPLVGSGIVRLV